MAEAPDVNFQGENGSGYVEGQCPSTPEPQFSVKSPTLSTGTDEPEIVPTEGSQSPPPNCAICLGRCKNKCFTDSCIHQFCFQCLLEWSKVKPECPLCKQNFKSIIHNVKSIDQFEEYHVQPVVASPIPHVYSPFSLPARYPRILPIYNGQVNLYMNDMAMNTLDLTGSSSSSSSSSSVNSEINRTVYDRRILPGAAQLLDMYGEQNPIEVGNRSLSQLWRRYIYDRRLYSLPLPDVTGRLRESSARFYRNNPSQVHRLITWINRDIMCLLRNTEHDINEVMDLVASMLMTCNILSPEFRRRLQPFLGTKTVHFIHELNNFARSPYDMTGYDSSVQYSSNHPVEVVIDFSSSSGGSDIEINLDLQVHEPNPNPPVSHQIQRNNYTMFSADGSVSSQSLAINLSTHNRGENRPEPIETEQPTTSTVATANVPTAQEPTNIVLSSASSDECEFVLEQKPPHLRTPEYVSLHSDTDSDVVFVQETQPGTTQPSSTSKWLSTTSSRIRRAQHRRANPTANSRFSTSSSDSEVDDHNGVRPVKMSRIDKQPSSTDPDNTRNTFPNYNNNSNMNNSNNNPVTKVKEEYNIGASTSTGIQSRYVCNRMHMPRKRHFEERVETSDTDESESTSDSYLSSSESKTSGTDKSWSKSRPNPKKTLRRSLRRKANTVGNRRLSTRRETRNSAKRKSTRSTRSRRSALQSRKSSRAAKKKSSRRSRNKTKNEHQSKENSSDKDGDQVTPPEANEECTSRTSQNSEVPETSGNQNGQQSGSHDIEMSQDEESSVQQEHPDECERTTEHAEDSKESETQESSTSSHHHQEQSYTLHNEGEGEEEEGIEEDDEDQENEEEEEEDDEEGDDASLFSCYKTSSSDNENEEKEYCKQPVFDRQLSRLSCSPETTSSDSDANDEETFSQNMSLT